MEYEYRPHFDDTMMRLSGDRKYYEDAKAEAYQEAMKKYRKTLAKSTKGYTEFGLPYQGGLLVGRGAASTPIPTMAPTIVDPTIMMSAIKKKAKKKAKAKAKKKMAIKQLEQGIDMSKKKKYTFKPLLMDAGIYDKYKASSKGATPKEKARLRTAFKREAKAILQSSRAELTMPKKKKSIKPLLAEVNLLDSYRAKKGKLLTPVEKQQLRKAFKQKANELIQAESKQIPKHTLRPLLMKVGLLDEYMAEKQTLGMDKNAKARLRRRYLKMAESAMPAKRVKATKKRSKAKAYKKLMKPEEYKKLKPAFASLSKGEAKKLHAELMKTNKLQHPTDEVKALASNMLVSASKHLGAKPIGMGLAEQYLQYHPSMWKSAYMAAKHGGAFAPAVFKKIMQAYAKVKRLPIFKNPKFAITVGKLLAPALMQIAADHGVPVDEMRMVVNEVLNMPVGNGFVTAALAALGPLKQVASEVLSTAIPAVVKFIKNKFGDWRDRRKNKGQQQPIAYQVPPGYYPMPPKPNRPPPRVDPNTSGEVDLSGMFNEGSGMVDRTRYPKFLGLTHDCRYGSSADAEGSGVARLVYGMAKKT